VIRYYARPRRRRRHRSVAVVAVACGLLGLVFWLVWGPRVHAVAVPGSDEQVAAESEPSPPPPDLVAGLRGEFVVGRAEGYDRKLMALTFDDGPDPSVTPMVLNALKQFGAHATFFVTGGAAKANPDLVRQMAREGNAVESHSYTHKKKPTVAEATDELDRTARIIEQATGRRPQCFRPPYGLTVSNYSKVAKEQGYCVVTWSLGSDDWTKIDAEQIAYKIVADPKPGEIALMHDTHTSTGSAVVAILRALTADGWRFVTVPELLNDYEKWKTTHEGGSGAKTPAK
jgi:peptidoglycan-N-acetylglucosamine deacetylase